MISRCLLNGLLLFLVLSAAGHAAAIGADALIRLGDSAYLHKAYDSAAHYYKLAAAADNGDATTLYKLGNAHYRMRRPGQAVLAYERALKRSPGFADAAENLALIQRQIRPAAGKEEVFFVRWWNELTQPSRSNSWAVPGIICFCFPLGMLAWSRFTRKRLLWLRPQVIVTGLLLSVFFSVLSVIAAYNGAPHDTAVVMRQNAVLHTGPTSRGKAGMITLPEGLAVKVLRKEKDEVLVTLPDGQEGLIQRSDIVIVE